jgi:Domain of unknown function (DUF929).
MSNARTRYKHGKRVRSSGANRNWIIVAAIVVVIGVALVVAVASGSKGTKPSTPASAALVRKVTSIPKTVFTQVKAGTATATPKPINAPPLTSKGKPQILYVGAEYCPFCATERWPMVIALSRFGSFSNLGATHSSSTDVFPNTATFSFHGATYKSQWIAFSGVETQSNQQQGDGYAPLDKLTTEQQQIFATYNAPPYTASAGGIPFIDFGGQFLVSGVTYDASVLSGKSADDIASALADSTTAISKGAIGAANTFTAAICSLTSGQPATVCNDPTIKEIATTLK